MEEVTRTITCHGAYALTPTLIRMLEQEGVRVERRHRAYNQIDFSTDTQALVVTLLATGLTPAINAAVDKFRKRFQEHAKITVEDEFSVNPQDQTTEGDDVPVC